MLFLLFSPGGAEAAGGAGGILEVILQEGGLRGGEEHQLGDAFPLFDSLGLGSMVQEGHQHLATIVGIDNAHLIGGGEAPFCGEAATGKDEAAVAFREFHGQAGMHQGGTAGINGHLFYAAKVCTCGVGRAIDGRAASGWSFLIFTFIVTLLNIFSQSIDT